MYVYSKICVHIYIYMYRYVYRDVYVYVDTTTIHWSMLFTRVNSTNKCKL